MTPELPQNDAEEPADREPEAPAEVTSQGSLRLRPMGAQHG
jgi:hypothetical protein